jgi:hypothetical protein
VALLTHLYLPEETILNLKFVVHETNFLAECRFYELVEVETVVRSILPAPEREYRLGLQFRALKRLQRRKILDLKYSLLKYERPQRALKSLV